MRNECVGQTLSPAVVCKFPGRSPTKVLGRGGADHRSLWSAWHRFKQMFYRRRLPHWIPPNATVFLTWRLAGFRSVSVPQLPSYNAQHWLKEPVIAGMLVNALQHGATVRQFYDLHAWVIMPNHVHVILRPRVELPELTRWLKGRTSRIANRMLGRTGLPFWQDESFDHWIRSAEELHQLTQYVEGNPVKAGLVQAPEEWPWSSARLQADDTNRSSAPLLPFREELLL